MNKILLLITIFSLFLTANAENFKDKELDEIEKKILDKKKTLEEEIDRMKYSKKQNLTDSQKKMIDNKIKDCEYLVSLLDDAKKNFNGLKKKDEEIQNYQKTDLLCLVSILDGKWKETKVKHKNKMKKVFKDLYKNKMMVYDILDAFCIYIRIRKGM